MKNIEFIICVVLTVVTAFVIAIWVRVGSLASPLESTKLGVTKRRPS